MSYFPSLQTHFNARVDVPTLEEIRALGFRWARIDCQTSDGATMAAMIDDADKAALHPLPIVSDLARLDVLGVTPAVMDVEWGNEPDGDILPSTYRTQLDLACERAAYFHLRLWAPALSNLDRNSLFWLERVRGSGWPSGLHGLSVHRYGDGTFERPHDGFDSREAEVEHLLRLCDGLPFIVTEFGYPTGPGNLTDAQQAERIGQEWAFWRAYTAVAVLYQLNDGPNPGETYGIRRYPWDPSDWKPAAYGVPQEDPPMADDTGKATFCISRARSFEAPGKPGAFHTYYPKHGPDGQPQTRTVLSIQPDGSKEMRPAEAAGAWETWVPSADGNRAVFIEAGESFAIPLVD